MPRRPNNARRVEELVDGAVEVGVDVLFDRAIGLVDSFRGRQIRALPSEYMSGQFKCVANTPDVCIGIGVVGDFEMVHPSNGYGACKRCFAFMWEAGSEKVKAALKARAAAAGRAAAAATGTGPLRQRPWEILGVNENATADEIKKAYRKLAHDCHPDLVPPDAGPEARATARRRFEEITRCKDAMLKVREAAR